MKLCLLGSLEYITNGLLSSSVKHVCNDWNIFIHLFVILGYGIFYANFLAHRDPDVFEKPEDFIPERWNGSNSSDQDKIFGFGSGPHRCIGENLMRDVMHFVGKVSDIIQGSVRGLQ